MLAETDTAGQLEEDVDLEHSSSQEVELVFSHSETQVTIRSLIIGGIAGSVIAVSNIYIGLQIGWSFGASQFAALMAFVILKPLSHHQNMPWGGYFGAKENCSAQTCGTAASMLSAGFTYSIPALYWTGALTGSAIKNIVSFLLFTTAVGFFGMFFAVPLRVSAIVHQKLPFPSGTSTAYLIKSLHESAAGAVEGVKKTKAMMFSFVLSLAYAILVHFVPILANLYIPAYCAGYSQACADAATLGWFFILSPLQIGSGLIMGLNSSISILVGCIAAWGIIGPLLYHFGVVDNLRKFGPENPGSDYFLIWTSISIMVFGAFADLFSQYQLFLDAVSAAYTKIKVAYYSYRRREDEHPIVVDEDGSDANRAENRPPTTEDEDDPIADNELVPTWVWMSGIVASCALTMIILQVYFQVAWYESLLANVLGFLLSFVAIQAAGRTDVNPIGMVGKLTQFVFAGINPNIATNLWTASVSSSAASQSVDMLGDLKTGHILRASPRGQTIAQGVGTVFGIFASVFGFVLFVEAYPCILENPDEPGYTCPFPMPPAFAWYGLALGLTTGFDKALPKGAVWGIVAGALFAVVCTILKKKLPEPYSSVIPNPVAFGLGFLSPSLIPQAIMFSCGGILSALWQRFGSSSHALYMVVVSAGMIAGEGVGGILVAVMLIAGSTTIYCVGIPDGYC